jgi:hypothetical protein
MLWSSDGRWRQGGKEARRLGSEAGQGACLMLISDKTMFVFLLVYGLLVLFHW